MNLYRSQYFRIAFLISTSFLFCLSACDKAKSIKDTKDYGYTIAVISPAEKNSYSIGDTLPIAIRFSSITGEIIHYISVKIINKNSEKVSLYSVQSHQHAQNLFDYNDYFILKDSSKIITGEDWILKAEMWSHETDTDTVLIKRDIRIKI